MEFLLTLGNPLILLLLRQGAGLFTLICIIALLKLGLCIVLASFAIPFIDFLNSLSAFCMIIILIKVFNFVILCIFFFFFLKCHVCSIILHMSLCTLV